MGGRVLGFSFIFVLMAGCDDTKPCPSEVKTGSFDVVSTNIGYAECAAAGDCTQLCNNTVQNRTDKRSQVLDCKLVGPDGGPAPGGSDGGVEQATLEVTYRQYAFCGS